MKPLSQASKASRGALGDEVVSALSSDCMELVLLNLSLITVNEEI